MSGVPGSVRGPSLAGRMAAAIVLTAGFYLLALAMVAGLVALAVLPWLHGGGRPALSVISLLIAGAIAVAIVPRRIRFEPPGPQLAPSTRPACTPCSPRRRRRRASACRMRST
jgi:heat shock protein HtpX